MQQKLTDTSITTFADCWVIGKHKGTKAQRHQEDRNKIQFLRFLCAFVGEAGNGEGYAEVALRVAEDVHETHLQLSACRYGAQAALRMGMNDKARELAAKALQLLESSSQTSLANEFASLVRSAGTSAEG